MSTTATPNPYPFPSAEQDTLRLPRPAERPNLPVVDARATISRITKTVRGKKVGFLESTGCKDGKRDVTVTFTTEDGQSQAVKKTLGYC